MSLSTLPFYELFCFFLYQDFVWNDRRILNVLNELVKVTELSVCSSQVPIRWSRKRHSFESFELPNHLSKSKIGLHDALDDLCFSCGSSRRYTCLDFNTAGHPIDGTESIFEYMAGTCQRRSVGTLANILDGTGGGIVCSCGCCEV